MATFGSAYVQTPAFGANTTGSNIFGTTTTSTAGTLGSFCGFPTSNAATNPTFGTQTTPAGSAFRFGAGTIGGAFGTPASSTAAPAFSSFGLTTTTTAAAAAAPAFNFNPIGTANPTQSFSNLGFGGATGSFAPGSLGTFGAGGGLGAKSSFATGGGFGTGSTFGTATPFAANTGLGSSGFGATSFSGFNQSFNQAPAANPQPNNALTNLATALSCPLVFGDERDVVLAKWNKLQAFWGFGKGYYTTNAPPVDFTPDNPFCRFKAIGYSCIPTAKNKDGLVALPIARKVSDVMAQQQQLVDSLHRILGSRPTLSVCVEGVKPVSENNYYLYLERAPTGASRRIPTSESFGFFNQPNVKTQLTQLGIEGVIPKSAPTKEQLKQYLDNPPLWIDPLLWQQAKLDNPDAEHLIPVPMIGFTELQLRLKFQEQETKLHQSRLNLIGDDISELQRKHANMLSRIAELKRKQLEMGHRVLKVMVKQETNRKCGLAVQADEEQLREQLEGILADLSAPTQFKGRLNELTSQIRMHNQQTLIRVEERYMVDVNLQNDIKQFLKQQQQGLMHLVDVVRSDLDDLRLIESGIKESGHRLL
uniref:Nucleoporin Nup54 alpha-helical domain-containing protein n=1 Tax=Strigamia maritima TaxID=126957 RepID=T1J213_STRMM